MSGSILFLGGFSLTPLGYGDPTRCVTDAPVSVPSPLAAQRWSDSSRVGRTLERLELHPAERDSERVLQGRDHRSSSPSAAVPDRGQHPFVGRDEEFAFCEAVIASGNASGVVVTGAAGVGKSRLAGEVLTAAEGRLGYATLQVAATESARLLPLGAFAHLIPVEVDGVTPSLELLRGRVQKSRNAQAIAGSFSSSTMHIFSTQPPRHSSNNWWQTARL